MKWVVLILALMAILGWALLAVVYEKLGGAASGLIFGEPQNHKTVQPQATPYYNNAAIPTSTFAPPVFRGPSASPHIIGPSGPPPNY